METARFEFYLSAIGASLAKADAARAESFWQLLLDTSTWFERHPDWRETITPYLV